MLCLEETGCPCDICNRKEVEYRLQKLKIKQKKEEDAFIQECIQTNKKKVNIQHKKTLVKTIYLAVYKGVMLPITLEYLQTMSTYNVKEHLLSLSKETSYYSSLFNRLDSLSLQFSNKRVKKDKYNVVLPYSLCFHLKDRAESYIHEWSNTITYLHTYNVLSPSDGVFKAELYSDDRLSLTRI